MFICAKLKRQDTGEKDKEEKIERLRREPLDKPIRIFLEEHNQQSCLELDVVSMEWIRVCNEYDPNQQNLDDIIVQSKEQQKLQRQEMMETLQKTHEQKLIIPKLQEQHHQLNAQLDELKLQMWQTLCRNEAIKKQVGMQQLRFSKYMDYALS